MYKEEKEKDNFENLRKCLCPTLIVLQISHVQVQILFRTFACLIDKPLWFPQTTNQKCPLQLINYCPAPCTGKL